MWGGGVGTKLRFQSDNYFSCLVGFFGFQKYVTGMLFSRACFFSLQMLHMIHKSGHVILKNMVIIWPINQQLKLVLYQWMSNNIIFNFQHYKWENVFKVSFHIRGVWLDNLGKKSKHKDFSRYLWELPIIVISICGNLGNLLNFWRWFSNWKCLFPAN